MEKSKQNKSEYTATCAECGVKFELPFIPTSDKPVYCNTCFKNKRNQGRNNRGGRDRRDRRDRQMFTAICDNCGKKAQVPFRPSGDKPIYCDNCFGKVNKGVGQKSDNLQEINKKLDLIIESLVAAKIIKLPKEEKPKKETKKTATKKEPAKKKATAKKTTPKGSSKPTKKKAPAKKKTTAKKKITAKKTNTKKKK